MSTDTADSRIYSGYSRSENQPEPNNLLDTFFLMLGHFKKERDDKIQALNDTHRVSMNTSNTEIKFLRDHIEGYDRVIQSIPDVRKHLEENFYSEILTPQRITAIAKEWIEKKVKQENEPKQSLSPDFEKIIEELKEKLSHVENKTIPAEQMKIKDGNKLLAFDKAKKAASGSLINVVIPVPDGCEIEMVVLKKVKAGK